MQTFRRHLPTIAFRICVSLAAAFLVVAFASASLLPPDLPLGQAWLSADKGSLLDLQNLVLRHGGARFWSDVIAPVLARPVWIPPTMIGIVLAGLAITVRPRPAAPPRRRRS